MNLNLMTNMATILCLIELPNNFDKVDFVTLRCAMTSAIITSTFFIGLILLLVWEHRKRLCQQIRYQRLQAEYQRLLITSPSPSRKHGLKNVIREIVTIDYEQKPLLKPVDLPKKIERVG